MSQLSYPLQLRFKLIAFAPRIIITDASGREVLYVHQKTFALKEDVRIYNDQSKSREIYRINAEKIMDFNTRYNVTDSQTGQHIGAIQPKGLRSIWSATYMLFDSSDTQTHEIEEDNPWVKVGDALLGEIPIIGMFTGYFLHPSYTVKRLSDGQDILRITKQAAFFEGLYTIDQLNPGITPEEESRGLMGLLLLIQFMRRRG